MRCPGSGSGPAGERKFRGGLRGPRKDYGAHVPAYAGLRALQQLGRGAETMRMTGRGVAASIRDRPRSTPLLRASGPAGKLRVVSLNKIIGVACARPQSGKRDEPGDEGGRRQDIIGEVACPDKLL